uniref:Thrombopoietin n=1 Tax=Sander lucioperca TaxID=283035 RepID=A0A8C9X1T7_SANLU
YICITQTQRNRLFTHNPTIWHLTAEVWVCLLQETRKDYTLPSPVQLPCVSLHKTEWAKKTLQQKRAEVVGALRVFQDGVQGARNQSTSKCQTSLLEKLGDHITNYLVIINRLQIQVRVSTSKLYVVTYHTLLLYMVHVKHIHKPTKKVH